jgi:hypothetical protein
MELRDIGLNGSYRLRPPAPAGYSVKRITLQGVDITDALLDLSGQNVEGVEVLLPQRITRVSGNVTGVGGRCEAAAVVISVAPPATRSPPCVTSVAIFVVREPVGLRQVSPHVSLAHGNREHA